MNEPKGATTWWSWFLALLVIMGLVWLVAELFSVEDSEVAEEEPDEGVIFDREVLPEDEAVASLDAAELAILADEREEAAQAVFAAVTDRSEYVDAATLWEEAAQGYLWAGESLSAAQALVDASRAYHLAADVQRGMQTLEQALAHSGADPAILEEARGVALELESVLAGRPSVRALIDSVPDEGVTVKYWRFTESNGPRLSATTNDSLRLDPALYVFTGEFANGQPLPRQMKDCSRPCRIRFVTR